MSVIHAVVLGLTQGLAEFLPISSSGHLILVPWLFGWNDFAGDDGLAKAFDVALHMGTLAGAIAYFRRDLLRYSVAGIGLVLGRAEGVDQPREGRFAWMLVASAIPAAITGVVFESLIEDLDDEFWLIAVMLIVFGLLLLVADRLGGQRQLDEFRLRDALGMGIGQALALQPGVSRSGVTITVGRWFGFNRDAAARISFLMSLPVTAGAGLYKAVDVFTGDGIPADARTAFAIGIVTSGITGYAAVWGTLRLVRNRTFTPFVIYRVVVGIAVLGLLSSSFR